MNLNDYLLVKVFSRQEYMKSFNEGNVFLSSTQYFWDLENSFQQDKEGLIFQQSGKGYILKTVPEFEKIIITSSSVENLISRTNQDNLGEVICETSDFLLGINGYICCFYLLPKKDVIFNKNVMSITSKTEREDIALFLERYLNELETKDFYVSIYDAVIFCNIFFKEMKEQGYKVTYGKVKYDDIDEIQKIRLYQNRNFQTIVFTKPTRYSYQKEFRIFLRSPDKEIKEHTVANGGVISNSLYCNFGYSNIIDNSK